MRQSLLVEVYFILATVFAVAVLTWTGLGPAFVWPLALTPYLGYNLYHLVRLNLRIRRHHRLTPPFPPGLWGGIFRAIAAFQQSGRKRRKRQIRFIRRFREAAMSVPDALVILDRLKRVEWANPAAATLMDVAWPRDDGKLLTELLRHRKLGELIEAGEYARPLEIAPDHNRAITLSLRITPFGERKRQRLVVARDVTKIYHLDMIRRDFVANASHELRTPLTVISGFLENLADSPATPHGHRRPLQLMRNQTERMRSIIEDLLTLSRLEMDDQSRAVEPVDVPDELHLILNEAQALSGGGHTFEESIDQDLLLMGNQLELRSAFSNLIFNAIKHTPTGSRVRVVWRRDLGEPLFSVEDDGEGIAAEHIPRLSERFYRVDTARSRASGGTGLGLAIVNHVLNRHGARLIIASEEGSGSSFSCRFPAESSLLRTRLMAATAAGFS
jgi:two-component system phosphate regulon sensor histidine kinase PhoR